jgi:hypothetical protein
MQHLITMSDPAKSHPFNYCPLFCEENIWHLCQHPKFDLYEKRVVFISNPQKTCAVWQQRSSADGARPEIWDYHVVLFARLDSWQVWDFDSLLPLGVGVEQYLSQTFVQLPEHYQQFSPRFKVFEGSEFVALLHSDRSHMLKPDGSPKVEHPSWPPILNVGGLGLRQIIDFNEDNSLCIPQILKTERRKNKENQKQFITQGYTKARR